MQGRTLPRQRDKGKFKRDHETYVLPVAAKEDIEHLPAVLYDPCAPHFVCVQRTRFSPHVEHFCCRRRSRYHLSPLSFLLSFDRGAIRLPSFSPCSVEPSTSASRSKTLEGYYDPRETDREDESLQRTTCRHRTTGPTLHQPGIPTCWRWRIYIYSRSFHVPTTWWTSISNSAVFLGDFGLH
jgi:hypothetical protein